MCDVKKFQDVYKLYHIKGVECHIVYLGERTLEKS